MNKQIRRLAAALLLCYVALFVQLNRLQVVKRDELADNPNNTLSLIHISEPTRPY